MPEFQNLKLNKKRTRIQNNVNHAKSISKPDTRRWRSRPNAWGIDPNMFYHKDSSSESEK